MKIGILFNLPNTIKKEKKELWNYIAVSFDKDDKIYFIDEPIDVGMDLLKAINKQCEELGL